MKITPVILSGGSGSRLWPLSRQDYPKQLLSLFSDNTLMQETALRFANKKVYNDPIVICNEAHRFAVAEQLHAVGIQNPTILLEPMGKNTAPAAAAACFYQLEHDTDSPLLVVASDHAVNNNDAFHDAVQIALNAANNDHLVMLGVEPAYAETGYGYINQGTALKGSSGCFNIKAFVEKPNKSTAASYVKDGGFFWNTGMFLFKPKAFLNELGKFKKSMVKACEASVKRSARDLDFVRLDKDSFSIINGDSIDWAVMEKTDRAACVPVKNMGWSDIGSWSSLWDTADKTDDNNNIVVGEVITENTESCYIRTHDKQLVATIGVKDLIVVSTKDAILVADKNNSQDVKKVVEALKAENRKEAVHHRMVYRPWGSYESVDEGERYQVKRIVVKPGEKLSLQKHFHRAEHWVIVEGTAIVTKDDDTLLLQENESVYLPLGCIHRLENPGRIPLTLVEVQSGSYLGEDDIQRFEDTYGRTG